MKTFVEGKIVNGMQIVTRLELINMEGEFVHSWYNDAETNPMEFYFRGNWAFI